MNHDLDDAIRLERDKENQVYGEYIKSGPDSANQFKDFTILPVLKEDKSNKPRASLSSVNLQKLVISHNDITDFNIFEDIKVGLNYSNMREIDLSDNQLGDNAIASICKAMN